MNELINGEALQALKEIQSNTIDAVVTDPPYGLSQLKTKEFIKVLTEWSNGDDSYVPPNKKGFMGESWDGFVPPPALWKEVYRVLKPGGHALVFAGSRTQDLMGLSMRIANFESRDCLHWVYGSGFPKSQDIGKMVDKKLGNEREIIGRNPNSREKCDKSNTLYESGTVGKTAYITKGHTEFEGWGTTLKPAYEPILVMRKPLEGTVVKNVLKHKTGGLNIDACRIESDESWKSTHQPNDSIGTFKTKLRTVESHPLGRFPSNIIFSNSETLETLERQSSGATRFFYCPKASKKEKQAGLSDPNTHKTVKPIALMEYLVRLVTPANGTVLDPFMGSGTTGIACGKEGFNFKGIEISTEYYDTACERIDHFSFADQSDEN